MNPIAGWLYLIGTPERAKKLRKRLDFLRPMPLVDQHMGQMVCNQCERRYPKGTKVCPHEPKQCPTAAMYNNRVSQKLYANPELRPAMDAWDSGLVTPADILRYCLYIERGQYDGPIFAP